MLWWKSGLNLLFPFLQKDSCIVQWWGGGVKGSNTNFVNKTLQQFENQQPALPSWRRGSVQEVAWLSGGKHAGGYSYRCCSFKLLLQVILQVTNTGDLTYRLLLHPHFLSTFESPSQLRAGCFRYDH